MRFAKFFTCLSIIFSVYMFVVPAKAQSEIETNLRLAFEKSFFLDPDSLTVALEGNSADGNVNVVDVHLRFDPSVLSLDSVAYADDICEFKILEKIDNEKGRIDFACGTIHATTTLAIAEFKFKKLSEGWSTITLDDSRFYLANGRGDMIMPATENHSFYCYK